MQSCGERLPVFPLKKLCGYPYCSYVSHSPLLSLLDNDDWVKSQATETTVPPPPLNSAEIETVRGTHRARQQPLEVQLWSQTKVMGSPSCAIFCEKNKKKQKQNKKKINSNNRREWQQIPHPHTPHPALADLWEHASHIKRKRLGSNIRRRDVPSELKPPIYYPIVLIL